MCPHCTIKSVSLSRWAIHALRAVISMNESRNSDSDAFATISVRYLRVNALADRPLALERQRERRRRGAAYNERIRFQTEFKDILPMRRIKRHLVLVF